MEFEREKRIVLRYGGGGALVMFVGSKVVVLW
jgi:hypothetical protein